MLCYDDILYSHLGLLRLQNAEAASEFWSLWSEDHRQMYPFEVSALSNIRNPESLLSNEFLASNDFV